MEVPPVLDSTITACLKLLFPMEDGLDAQGLREGGGREAVICPRWVQLDLSLSQDPLSFLILDVKPPDVLGG